MRRVVPDLHGKTSSHSRPLQLRTLLPVALREILTYDVPDSPGVATDMFRHLGRFPFPLVQDPAAFVQHMTLARGARENGGGASGGVQENLERLRER